MNGYQLTKQYFAFAAANPGATTPGMCALFMWLVEVNNRSRFTQNFFFNAEDAGYACGMQSRKTVWKYLVQLEAAQLVRVVYKSNNQERPSVLSLCLEGSSSLGGSSSSLESSSSGSSRWYGGESFDEGSGSLGGRFADAGKSLDDTDYGQSYADESACHQSIKSVMDGRAEAPGNKLIGCVDTLEMNRLSVSVGEIEGDDFEQSSFNTEPPQQPHLNPEPPNPLKGELPHSNPVAPKQPHLNPEPPSPLKGELVLSKTKNHVKQPHLNPPREGGLLIGRAKTRMAEPASESIDVVKLAKSAVDKNAVAKVAVNASKTIAINPKATSKNVTIATATATTKLATPKEPATPKPATSNKAAKTTATATATATLKNTATATSKNTATLTTTARNTPPPKQRGNTASPALAHSYKGLNYTNEKNGVNGARMGFGAVEEPELSEVSSFFTRHGYTAGAAAKAWAHYRQANWHDVQGRPVLNWQQKCRTIWFTPENRIVATQSRFVQ